MMARLATTIRTIFAIDLRTLALFRVTMACLLLADLLDRWRNIQSLYTDQGVLPRPALLQVYGSSMQWTSLHYYTGVNSTVQSFVFAMAAIAAIALLFGYRTWFATLLSWLLLISLNRRVPSYCYGYDDSMRLLLFWSLFLPLGARWSFDSALNSGKRIAENAFCSVATMGILLQVCYVYWFTVILKLHPSWLEGRAVQQAMQLDIHVGPIGQWLSTYDSLTVVLTYATLVGEAVFPLIALSPVYNVWARWIAILSMWALHIGIAVCMSIGFFPYISMMFWVLFIPTATWESLFRWLRTPNRTDLTLNYGPHSGCQTASSVLRTFLLLPDTSLRDGTQDPEIGLEMQHANSWIVQDPHGRHRSGFDGLIAIARASPLLSWMAGILARPTVSRLGDKLYQWLANASLVHRLGNWLLRWRPLRVQPRRFSSVLAAVLLLFITAYNVLGLDQLNKRGVIMPRSMNLAAQLLRIDQKWQMYAPTPDVLDGWYVMPARLKDGSLADVWSDDAVTYTKPSLISSTFPSIRFRKLLLAFRARPESEVWLWLARYVVREWNATHSPSQTVERLQIIFIGEEEHNGDTFLRPMIEYDPQQDSAIALSPTPIGK